MSTTMCLMPCNVESRQKSIVVWANACTQKLSRTSCKLVGMCNVMLDFFRDFFFSGTDAAAGMFINVDILLPKSIHMHAIAHYTILQLLFSLNACKKLKSVIRNSNILFQKRIEIIVRINIVQHFARFQTFRQMAHSP